MAIFARSGHVWINPGYTGKTRVTGTGTVTLGFQPKAVIAWASLLTSGTDLELGNVDGRTNSTSVGVFVRETTGAPEGQSITTYVGRAGTVLGGVTYYDALARNRFYVNDGMSAEAQSGLRDFLFNVTSFTATGFAYSYDIDYRDPQSVVWLALGGDDLRAAVRTFSVPYGVAANATFDVDTVGFAPKAYLSFQSYNDDHYIAGTGYAFDAGGGVAVARNVTATGAAKPDSSNTWATGYRSAYMRWTGVADGPSEPVAAEVEPTTFLSNGVRFRMVSPRASLTEPQATLLFLGGPRLLAYQNEFWERPVSSSQPLSVASGFQHRAVYALGAALSNANAGRRGRTAWGFATAGGGSWSQNSYWHSTLFPHDVDVTTASNAQLRIAKNNGALIGLPDFSGVSAAAVKTLTHDYTTGLLSIPALSSELVSLLIVGETPDSVALSGGTAAATSVAVGTLIGPYLVVTPANPALAAGASTASAASLSLSAVLGTPQAPVTVRSESAATGAFGNAAPFAGVTLDPVVAASLAQATGLIDADQLLPEVTAAGAAAVSGDLVVTWLLATADAPATAEAASVAEAYTAYTFPTILPARSVDIPGTINLVPDPGYESGRNWTASGVTLAAATPGWTGARAARAAFTASGQAVTVETVPALGTTTALAHVGSLRIRGAGAAARARLEAVYADATTDAGAWTALAPTAEWTVAATAALTTAAGKVLSFLRLRVEATAAGTLDLDGAQIERGAAATAWCSGALGEPAGAWLGVADASPSWRQTVPMWTGSVPTPTGGRGGAIRVEARLYRATHDNRFIEDISEWVVDGRVTMDTNRDVTWSLDATILGDGWSRLTPYLDWVAPYLTVSFPDGSVSQGQLGLYLVMDSPVSRREYGSTVQLTAMDPLWLLGAQGMPGPTVARGGEFKSEFVRRMIDGAVLTRNDTAGGANNGVRRYLIPTATLSNGYPAPFFDTTEWEAGTSRLRVINDALLSAGCTPLYTTRTGVFTSRRLNLTLNDRLPVRTYAANAPAGWALDNRVDRGLFGDVIEAVDTSPYADGLQNEVLLVNDAVGNPLQVRYRITDSDNYRSFAAGSTGKNRRNTRRIAHRYIDHPELAAEVARALAESLSLRNETARLRVLPEPHLELARETVGLAVFDAAGDPVITGKWAVQRASYGFTPSDAWMELEVARVYGISGVAEVYQ